MVPVGKLRLILIGAALVGSCYRLAAAFAVTRFARTAGPRTGHRPPVTILKPLSGTEPGLYANLASFCRQDYPGFQIVFGVADPADPARAVAERVMRDHPLCDCTVVVAERLRGHNRKVATLVNMMPSAHHDLLVIADSDMRVGPHYLRAVVAPFADPGIGLVTCLYAGRPDHGLWSRLGAAFINQDFLPSVLVGGMLGARQGCFGATMAVRRDCLTRIGGLGVLADHLADDYLLGAHVRDVGGRVLLSRYLVDDIVREPTFVALLRHELRWFRTLRVLAPVEIAATAVTYPVALSVLAFALSRRASGRRAVAVAVLALVCRTVQVRAVDRMLRAPPTPPWLVAVRDCLSFVMLIAGFFGSGVVWRGRRFRVRRDGRLIPQGDARP